MNYAVRGASRGCSDLTSERVVSVGRLYDAVEEIDRVCQARGLDSVKVKGEISMRAGFFLAIVFPHTPDDTEKLDKLRTAARDVLGVSLSI